MIDSLIHFSIKNKLLIGLFALGLIAWGLYSFKQIPIDAVPDITNNQVQVITQSPTLAAQEVEQFITFPIELSLANLPEVEQIRSISRFGISVITVVFEDHVDIYKARQLISEQLKTAESDIPEDFGKPELGPISTGLGEVYQYILHKAEGFEDTYTDMDLRTINDWMVKRQLAGTPGVIEVSGWGGHLKQYEVAVDPKHLNSMDVSISDIFIALKDNNENAGGSYIEKKYNTYFIRGEGLVKSIDDIEQIVVKIIDGTPILIKDIAEVGFGSAPRYGAITWNGKGEVVGGQVLMLKGENSFDVVAEVKKRVEALKKSLPEGVVFEPFLDRSKLISGSIRTVSTNLIEGGLIVILILILLLGNLRGGLIVASVIPLSMLFAMGMMNLFGVSANLMSLGALDFGLVVDGSVIIVESIIHRLRTKFAGRELNRDKMNKEVALAASKIRSSAAFGEVIILIVYLPILALVGIEGKMFKPMAQTVGFAIFGALILSMTYVPMMTALCLNKNITNKITISDKIINRLQSWYSPAIHIALKRRALVVASALALFVMSIFTFNKLGGEFIPTLEEGDMALHQILPPGSSLSQSVAVSKKIHKVLLDEFPEVIHAVSKIGTSEIPTDPMPIEVGDIMLSMKPKDQWTSARTKEEMFEKMEVSLSKIPGVEYEFTQPIQMRFNELIAGIREDIAIKIFGENTQILQQKAKEAEKIISGIAGIGDLRVERTQGLPQLKVIYDRGKIAQYGLNIKDLNLTLKAGFAGAKAGVVFEEERRFDLVVRLKQESRKNISDLENLYIPLPNGEQVPLKELARIEMRSGPMQISREDAKRKIVIGVNARDRDTESLVEEIQKELALNLELDPGYYIRYGGQFENLVAAKKRLGIAVPVALLLILVLLFFTFNSIPQALLIFTAIPLSAIGGIYALWLRDMPLSISAGVGFIALFGVAVLNGIVLISYLNELKREGVQNINERILIATKVRLRPVLMTASVAALGFLPMALSSSAGAEVQRPLATVVIGGLITATFLTLIVLPALYSWLHSFKTRYTGSKAIGLFLFMMIGITNTNYVAAQEKPNTSDSIRLKDALDYIRNNHPRILAENENIEAINKLKKANNGLDKTKLSYTNGQLNSSEMDYQWQVNQSFDFPTAYLERSKAGKQRIVLAEIKKARELLKLEEDFKNAWSTLLFSRLLTEEYEKHLLSYDNYIKAVTKKYELGISSSLEKAYALSRYKLLQSNLEQERTQKHSNSKMLSQYLPPGKTASTQISTLFKEDALLFTDDLYKTNLEFKHASGRYDLASKERKSKISEMLPGINLGYFNQRISSEKNLQGLQFGLNIPLFIGKQINEIKYYKHLSNSRNHILTATEMRIKAELEAAKLQIQNKLSLKNWYEEEGLGLAAEFLQNAKLAFSKGSIDYLDYLRMMNDSFDLKKGYLKSALEYQIAVNKMNYLTSTSNN